MCIRDRYQRRVHGFQYQFFFYHFVTTLMRNTVFALLLLVLTLQLSYSYNGVDLSQLFSESDYQCLKTNGMGFVIARGYCSDGVVDPNVVQSLKNAKAAEIPYQDIYMFPCVGKSASTQASELVAAIPSSLFGMVWIDVETNSSPNCGWSTTDFTSNCNFLGDLVKSLQSNGLHVGIYASSYMWRTIFGSDTACPNFTSLAIWYAHYDNNPSFSDWTDFGGWTKPSIKQYKGTTTYCGASVDLDYYP
eukprot:TRINITY_DN34652_c0_g1_i3.p2 TRINITY_DN34652_c0_g1~~TRINITY_DN34652_c0_g1_i3.p2  ORF type:complete len:247 (+),score=39.79 TRINITY_DN34652_c0_g1_i3:204-944(+)